ncbi:MAG: hypothetical protein ACJ0GH_03640 [Alphaproteobacteria bacterium]
MKAIIVNPSTPIGPGDIKPTPTGKNYSRYNPKEKCQLMWDTGLNFVSC